MLFLNTAYLPEFYMKCYNKNTYGIVFTIFLLPLLSMAQKYVLSGKVLDNTNMSLPYASVLLLTKDSVTVKGDYTDETGIYRIENIDPATYYLKISALGYQPQVAEITIQADILNQVTTLEQEMLREVVLTAKKPTIERLPDRLVFNVENTILSEGTAWNTLTKTPYLLEMGGSITVKGKQNPLIYINNRRVYLSSDELKQLLEGTPGNILKSVEVILNPPASYDAEGAAVINIVMAKNLSTGYNGSVGGTYTQGIYPKFNLTTSHFYKTDKLNTFFTYSRPMKKNYFFFSEDMDFFTDGVQTGRWYNETTSVVKNRSHSLMSNADYKVNDQQSLNVSVNANFTPFKRNHDSSTTQSYDIVTQQPDSLFHSLTQLSETRHNVALSLDYSYNLGEGKNLTANVHHTWFNFSMNQSIVANYEDADGAFIRRNEFEVARDQSVRIYTAQSDYSNVTKKMGSFNTGAKWSYIEFDNTLTQVNIEGDNPDFSDLFFYKETNLAGYLDYENSWKHWDIKAGIRGEHTQLEGNSALEGATSQKYFKIFPTANITYNQWQNHIFTLSYSKRISRPRFNDLNPFPVYIRDNAYWSGNPNLRPDITHQVDLSYTIQQSLTFSLYYRRRFNSIYELSFVDNETNEFRSLRENVGKNKGYGIDVTWNKYILPWWSVNLYSSFFSEEDIYTSSIGDGERVSRIKLSGLLFYRISNSLVLSKDKTFTGDISFMRQPDLPWGNYIWEGQSNLSFGLMKTLWSRRATLSLSVNDILKTLPYNSIVNYADQSIRAFTDYESRTVDMRFTYRFGNYKLRVRRKDIQKEERDRL